MFDANFDGYYCDNAGLTGAVLHEMFLSSVGLPVGWHVINGRYEKSVFVVGRGFYRIAVIMRYCNTTDRMILCIILFRGFDGNMLYYVYNVDYAKVDISGNCSPIFDINDNCSVESAVSVICDKLYRIMLAIDRGVCDD